jgi:hypothetical protein
MIQSNTKNSENPQSKEGKYREELLNLIIISDPIEKSEIEIENLIRDLFINDEVNEDGLISKITPNEN